MASFFENIIKSIEIERHISKVSGKKIIIWGAGEEAGRKHYNIIELIKGGAI